MQCFRSRYVRKVYPWYPWLKRSLFQPLHIDIKLYRDWHIAFKGSLSTELAATYQNMCSTHTRHSTQCFAPIAGALFWVFLVGSGSRFITNVASHNWRGLLDSCVVRHALIGLTPPPPHIHTRPAYAAPPPPLPPTVLCTSPPACTNDLEKFNHR